MNKILETFGKPKVFLPVVHCIDMDQVREQVSCARENGADGIWLINQGGMSTDAVLAAAMEAPMRWVGVNLLGLTATAALAKVRSVTTRSDRTLNGVWNDDAHVRVDERERFGQLTRSGWGGPYPGAWMDWRPLFFGGVAFKHRAHVPDEYLGSAAAEASASVDVVTTSGPQTGTPPTVDKVRAMREGLGDHALAVASGITPENVHLFLPYVDAFLVASGIEENFGAFDPHRVRALADAIHGSAEKGAQ